MPGWCMKVKACSRMTQVQLVIRVWDLEFRVQGLCLLYVGFKLALIGLPFLGQCMRNTHGILQGLSLQQSGIST